MKRVIIFGAYGNFGKLLSRSFLKSDLPITICGRNSQKLQKQAKNLQQQFNQSIDYQVKDINDNLSHFLHQNKSSILINTCGPFQNANYRVVQACIQAGVDYIDLADGRDFVTNMKQYNEMARQKQVSVITGASSVPGLSSAIIQQFKDQFKKIEQIQYGISPGQKTTRGGIATVKAVMGYIGKQIRPYGNMTQPIYGWQDLYQQKYPTLGTRLFGNCQVPDLDLFPQHYGIQKLRFSAGMESKILHIGIWLTSWLIRLGVPINLPKYASVLLKISHIGFDWMGSDEGGLHMTIRGIDASQKLIQRKWYIIIRKGHGPNVPVAPAIILGRKLAKHEINLFGVNPCVGLVSLQEYLNQLRSMDVQVLTQKRYL